MTDILIPQCSCHVINPQKTPILAWLRNDKLLVKIANQRFIGHNRIDKNGQPYWRCKDLIDEPNLEEKKLSVVEKFQQRQEQAQLTKNHGNTNSENTNHYQ